jgi:hypothetical protein
VIAALFVESIERHFVVLGWLSAGQLREHEATGTCCSCREEATTTTALYAVSLSLDGPDALSEADDRIKRLAQQLDPAASVTRCLTAREAGRLHRMTSPDPKYL